MTPDVGRRPWLVADAVIITNGGQPEQAAPFTMPANNEGFLTHLAIVSTNQSVSPWGGLLAWSLRLDEGNEPQLQDIQEDAGALATPLLLSAPIPLTPDQRVDVAVVNTGAGPAAISVLLAGWWQPVSRPSGKRDAKCT